MLLCQTLVLIDITGLKTVNKPSFVYRDPLIVFVFVFKMCLTAIQRVQNPAMYRSYVMKKQSMDEKNGNHKNERYLFHGTAHHNARDITAHGFNRSFCGSNGKSMKH